MCNKGFTVLSATRTQSHEPYLPLRHLAAWYSLRLPTKGWLGWVDVGGWLYTEINVTHRELNPDTITNSSTNRARRRLTSLIETNALQLGQTSASEINHSVTPSSLRSGHDALKQAVTAEWPKIYVGYDSLHQCDAVNLLQITTAYSGTKKFM